MTKVRSWLLGIAALLLWPAWAMAGSYTANVNPTGCGACLSGWSDYACESGCGSGSFAAMAFTDQTPVGGVVTSVQLVSHAVYGGSTVSASINGNSLGSNAVATNFNCGPTSDSTFSASSGAVLAGWVYRGANHVSFDDTGDICLAEFTVTVTYDNGPLAISPASATTTPKGSVHFDASGGAGAYTWSLATNASGGSITSGGVYTAGTTGSVTDVVQVSDGSTTVTANVAVGPGITLSPSPASTTPDGSIHFTATGGSGAGYTFAFASGGNLSGGTLSTAGAYKAGLTGGVADLLSVTDSLGNTVQISVSVGAGVSLSPASPTTYPRGSITFTTTGGAGGYAYSIASTTGSTITPGGVYKAGTVGNTTDTVTVTDSNGDSASTTVTVGAGVSIAPPTSSIAPLGSIHFTVAGGSGSGYTYTYTTDGSGGSLDTSTGAYVAGTIGNVTDLVTVSDSVGNSATATVSVGPAVTITGGTSTPPKGSISFSASGGSGMGFVWTLSGGSGGTIDPATGAYTAGAMGNTTDTATVTDSLGNTASVTVSVGAGLAVTPSSPSTPPMGSLSFMVTGGSGTGFDWQVTTKGSGAASIDASGNYTAGAIGNSVDVVTVTDSLGNTASVNVGVGGGVAINPSNPSTTPKGTLTFTASGGSGNGYTWALGNAPSGGSIDPSTGVYTAGATGNSVDVVTVTDSLGNKASVNVSVGPAVSVSPSSATVAPLGVQPFVAAGGNGAYTWSINPNNSGGSIDNTGAYAAGSTGGVVDTIVATDSLGNSGTATVTVGAGVSITSSVTTTPPLGSIALAATGGSGTGYTWAVTTNGSHATINSSTGAYTAGSVGSTSDVVTVTDSLGNTASVTITVGPGVSFVPATTPSVPPLGTYAFAATGGLAPYTFTLTQDGSGGTITSDGAYMAGSTPNVTDTVTVTDSLGNVAQGNVSVGGGLTINPSAPSAPPRGSIAFTVVGGSGTGYAWAVSTNASGATIDAASGAYVAGAKGNVTDVVTVTDSLGNASTVMVAVTGGVQLSPSTAMAKAGDTITFMVSGGSGKGFVWSLATNESGGTIANGVYKAGTTGGMDVVEVVDSLGNSATSKVTVTGVTVGGPDGGSGAPDMGSSGDGGVPVTKHNGGCGCDVGGQGSSGLAGMALTLLALGALLLRRRRA